MKNNVLINLNKYCFRCFENNIQKKPCDYKDIYVTGQSLEDAIGKLIYSSSMGFSYRCKIAGKIFQFNSKEALIIVPRVFNKGVNQEPLICNYLGHIIYVSEALDFLRSENLKNALSPPYFTIGSLNDYKPTNRWLCWLLYDLEFCSGLTLRQKLKRAFLKLKQIFSIKEVELRNLDIKPNPMLLWE
jgi:hypothetical protein